MKNFQEHDVKRAFTLAEILITLGVIGVVAAITLTPLIKNYQKTVWTNQLRKSVSMFSQGFKKWMADDGVDSLKNTEAFITYVDIFSKSVYPEMGYTNNRVVGVFNAMKKYFKITYIGPIGDYSYKTLGTDGVTKTIGGDHAVILADGTMFFNYSFNTIDGQGYSVQLYLDVNGKKGPNILGRDVFVIWFNDAGLVTKHSFHHYCNPSSTGSPSANGMGCVEKIMNDNWKMKY